MSNYCIAGMPYSDELWHHGIIGQKWGVRRYQNRDGSLTPEGQERYGSSRKAQHDLNRLDKERAYLVGDRMKALNRYNKATKKMTKYATKKGYVETIESPVAKAHIFTDPPAGQDKRYDRMKAVQAKRNQELSVTNRNLQNIDEQAKQLVDSIRGIGWNVTESPTFRETVRNGEYITRSIIGMGMAMPMAYLSPIGIGVGYGGRMTEPTRGTKYKVSY